MAEMTEFKRSRKSVITGFAGLVAVLFALTAFTYFSQGTQEDHWWSSTYILSLAIPFTLIPLIVWIVFVPSRVRYDREAFELSSYFFGTRQLSFSTLEKWGFGQQVLFLKFEPKLVQIALAFYPQIEQAKLLAFLATNFPERKSSWLVLP
jgi:hypothetical protein